MRARQCEVCGKIESEETPALGHDFSKWSAAAGDPTVLSVFPDRDEAPRWAAGDLAWAVENGLIKGSNLGGQDYLQPEGRATRAQVVTILQRYLATTAKEETP